MAIKRVVSQEITNDHNEKRKLRARFKDKLATANTILEIKKCLGILARHVFDEKDGE